MIRIYITDALYEKEYEVRVNEQLSFYELVPQLREMMDLNRITTSSLSVYEYHTERPCDIDVSLSSLKIENGMHFVVL